MNDKVVARLTGLEEGQADMKGVLARTNKAVKTNAAKLDKHAGMIKANADAIAAIQEENRKRKAEPEPFPAPGGRPRLDLPAPSPATVSQVEDIEYDVARRLLRIWPVHGANGREMWKSTWKFLQETLELTDIPESRVEEVSRPRFPSGFMVKEEALVRFSDTETRDTVLGSSSKLSCMFRDGKPTAGIRIEVTKKLTPAFKTLQKFGQVLRRRHGEGFRRHIKFDDQERCLFLNVKLPGDQRWSPVPLEVARRGMSAREKKYSEDLERRLDASGTPAPEVERPRAASTGTEASQRRDRSQRPGTSWRGPQDPDDTPMQQ